MKGLPAKSSISNVASPANVDTLNCVKLFQARSSDVRLPRPTNGPGPSISMLFLLRSSVSS
eukprot:952453-Rhodomonas_salina.1